MSSRSSMTRAAKTCRSGPSWPAMTRSSRRGSRPRRVSTVIHPLHAHWEGARKGEQTKASFPRIPEDTSSARGEPEAKETGYLPLSPLCPATLRRVAPADFGPSRGGVPTNGRPKGTGRDAVIPRSEERSSEEARPRRAVRNRTEQREDASSTAGPRRREGFCDRENSRPSVSRPSETHHTRGQAQCKKKMHGYAILTCAHIGHLRIGLTHILSTGPGITRFSRSNGRSSARAVSRKARPRISFVRWMSMPIECTLVLALRDPREGPLSSARAGRLPGALASRQGAPR